MKRPFTKCAAPTKCREWWRDQGKSRICERPAGHEGPHITFFDGNPFVWHSESIKACEGYAVQSITPNGVARLVAEIGHKFYFPAVFAVKAHALRFRKEIAASMPENKYKVVRVIYQQPEVIE